MCIFWSKPLVLAFRLGRSWPHPLFCTILKIFSVILWNLPRSHLCLWNFIMYVLVHISVNQHSKFEGISNFTPNLYLFEIWQVFLWKVTDFHLHHLHFAFPLGQSESNFRQIFGVRKLFIEPLSYHTLLVCVILYLAILVELWLVTDRQTDRPTYILGHSIRYNMLS